MSAGSVAATSPTVSILGKSTASVGLRTSPIGKLRKHTAIPSKPSPLKHQPTDARGHLRRGQVYSIQICREYDIGCGEHEQILWTINR